MQQEGQQHGHIVHQNQMWSFAKMQMLRFPPHRRAPELEFQWGQRVGGAQTPRFLKASPMFQTHSQGWEQLLLSLSLSSRLTKYVGVFDSLYSRVSCHAGMNAAHGQVVVMTLSQREAHPAFWESCQIFHTGYFISFSKQPFEKDIIISSL